MEETKRLEALTKYAELLLSCHRGRPSVEKITSDVLLDAAYGAVYILRAYAISGNLEDLASTVEAVRGELDRVASYFDAE